MKRYEDPKWAASMALSLDYNYAMAEAVGENGLKEAELQEIAPRLQSLERTLNADRQQGRLGFLELPYQAQILKELQRTAKPLLEWLWDVVLLGMGGSALAARALQQALCHPQHNKMPMARRQHRPGLWIADNLDPDHLFGLLDGLDLRRTGLNVVSKSGDTPETLAQFMWLYRLLKGRLGEDRVRERCVVTTGPAGALRQLALQKGFATLTIPEEIPGRFSIFSAVGLFPAVLLGIDAEELLAGARFMDQRLRQAGPEQNLAYRLAALYFLFASRRARSIMVLMPYASTLAGLVEWCSYLWAESLGKKLDRQGRAIQTGVTPVGAQGATDQHSQLQLYMEGPQDKLITFLEVGTFKHNLEIPDTFGDLEACGYLRGHNLGELLLAEKRATAFNLLKAHRPSLTLRLPEINPFTIGQLLYLWQVVTLAVADLQGVNPLDTPGVAGGKATANGLMGRPGFEAYQREFLEAPAALEKYTLS